MKAALLVLLVLQLVSGAILGIGAFSQSLLLGILSIASAVLGILPIIALLWCMDDVDDLRSECVRLQCKLYQLEKAVGPVQQPIMKDGEAAQASPLPIQTANRRWTCPKCQSVNAEGTSFCQECGARYASDFGGLEERPLTKWKLKDYKKRKGQE